MVVPTACFIAVYYLLLPSLPATGLQAVRGRAEGAWHTRFDIAQFIGTILWPPRPTSHTWILGLAGLTVLLCAGATAYVLLLKWSRMRSTVWFAIGYACSGYVATGIAIWLAMGYQPAVMGGELPDPGFFLLGWSGWASVQLLLCFVVYGLALAWCFRSEPAP
jgi:hypothetical protein